MTVSKQTILAEEYGFNTFWDLIEEYICDNVCPGICVMPECNHTITVEPDQDQGYCESCQTPTIKSGMVLAGFFEQGLI